MQKSWMSRSRRLEFALELSSEVPGTNADWPSDISLWVNDVKVGTWTSPGDYGDRRGVHTPRWWKLEGSQYGALTQWHISSKGTFMGAKKLSSVTLAQLRLAEHHSILPADRYRRQRRASRRRQYFRPRLWQS